MTASAQLLSEPGGGHRLKLEGRLPPLWAGNLATGLASNRVGIISGRAKETGLDWSAEFVLDFQATSSPPASLDFVKLAHSENREVFGGAIRIARYTVSRLPSGMLEVSIQGPDQP